MLECRQETSVAPRGSLIHCFFSSDYVLHYSRLLSLPLMNSFHKAEAANFPMQAMLGFSLVSSACVAPFKRRRVPPCIMDPMLF